MINYNFTAEQMREKIESKLSHNFGVTPGEATDEHFYKAVALVVRDLLSRGYADFAKRSVEQGKKEGLLSVYGISDGAFPEKQPV